MIVGQYQFTDDGWTLVQGSEPRHPHLVLIFGSAEPASLRGAIAAMRAGFPEAQIAGCTTGGEMLAGHHLEESIVAAAIEFQSSHVHAASTKLTSRRDSFAAGRRLGQAVTAPGLKGVLVLAEGIDCDGSLLLAGLTDVVGDSIPVFGGLAGDRLDFVVTRVAANGPFESGQVVAVGFFGPLLEIAHGAAAGWQVGQSIGTITNSASSIIYEIDQSPALDLLRRTAQLGKRIDFHDLMRVPLWITDSARGGAGVIRTVVGIDEDRGALIMAGDVPRHGDCSIMYATAEDITAGATSAAAMALEHGTSGLAFCVSCVGRKEVLGEAAGEEVEAVARRIGAMPQIGFYSYGELGRNRDEAGRFLNQTMCVTIIGERVR